MKKIVSILLVLIMVLGVCSVVNATTAVGLADELYSMGKPYGMTASLKVRIERYVSDYKVTNAEADKIVAKAEEAVKLMKEADATKYSELTDEEKEEMKKIANEAADILGLTLVIKADSVEIYKDGKLIEVAKYDGDKLMYTGNNVNTILVVSSVVAIALVASFTARKKFANA